MAIATKGEMSRIENLLGGEAADLLNHRCKTIPKENLHLPRPNYLDSIFISTDRSNQVMRNMHALFNHGRLAGPGFLSIFPADPGIEHSARPSPAPTPGY